MSSLTVIGAGASAASAAFSPDQVSGLILWLKADSLALNDGDSVTTWADSSASANDVTQATAANKPTFQTNEVNGKPIVRFDDVNDRLQRTDDADFDFGTGNFSIFAVVKANGSTQGAIICKANFEATNGFYLRAANSATQYAYWNGSVHTDFGAVGTAFHLLGVVREGTGASQTKLYYDAALATSVTDSQNMANAVSLSVGVASNAASDFFGGDIAEILVYNTNVSTADRQSIETYFDSKYALAF